MGEFYKHVKVQGLKTNQLVPVIIYLVTRTNERKMQNIETSAINSSIIFAYWHC